MSDGPRHLLLTVERRLSNGKSKWAPMRVHKDAIAWYEPAPVLPEGGGDGDIRWGVRALIDGMGWVGIDIPIHQLDRYCLEAEILANPPGVGKIAK